MNLPHEYAKAITRRHFFGKMGLGVGAIALNQMLAGDSANAAGGIAAGPLSPRLAALAPKAKSVIYLHMAGSPTQLDLFDYKPTLVRLNGQNCPDEFLKGKRFAFIKGVPKMLGTPFKFAQHGRNGVWLSEVWKHLPNVLDDIAIVKSMNTEQFNHAPAQLLLHTGTQLLGGASLGVGHIWPWHAESGPSRLCRPHERRQNARCRRQRMGQRVSPERLPGRAMPYGWRPGPLSLQPRRS